ncbi:MAG TPA: aldehyde ferredoxin oxidoreductase family protein [Desulfomonilaceae bacterium]|nr:aldehyde ferredoxin oxidoreductase family protein [Desulfomonilaceae bacterium]
MGKGQNSAIGKGYWGRVCLVDLTSGTIRYEAVAEEIYRKFLSGMGLAAKIVWDRMKPGCDPVGPENILGFTTGLLTDTGSLFTGRFMIVGKSPLSGGWGDSNCGGFFAPMLKRCGVDALFFEGASPTPVYLYIDEQRAELRDAADLWGKDTIETEAILRDRYKAGAQVACIGPAGEKLSYMAGVSTDYGRMAARAGLGAVMGSKKLKAVVAAGKRMVAVADERRMKELSRQFRARFAKYGRFKGLLNDRLLAFFGWLTGKGLYVRQPAVVWRLMLKKFGTPSLTAMSVETGDSPIQNWKGTVTDFQPEKYRKLRAEEIGRYDIKKYGCYSCPLRCGATSRVMDGPYKIEKSHRPEYETICSFGDLLLNDDAHSIFKLNDMANRGGVDSISCGGVVAFAIECFTKGIIDKSDTNGLELGWGKSEAIIGLTRMIIDREGIGDILADGVKIAAKKIGKGSEEFAVHCGGVEPAMHDAKFDPGFAVAYYCEPAPGRHSVTGMQYLDLQFLENQFSRAAKIPLFSTRKKRYDVHDKGNALAVGVFYKMLVDGAGVCLFGTQTGGDLPLCQWMNAATGWDFAPDDYLRAGERVEQLRQAFNVKNGLNPLRDFRPHPRIYGQPPLYSGPLKGITLDVDSLALSFYRAMHWDPATGIPGEQHLRELGLTELIEAFYP